MNDLIVSCLADHMELARDCYRHLEGRHKDEPLRVAVCGVYNAGKSSLLNSLAGRGEAFRTGAARVTTDVSELLVGQVVYVDTPGSDGAQQDDTVALAGTLRADRVLYAHPLSEMEFQQQERAWLRRLARELQDAPKRLALVITKADDTDGRDDERRQHAIEAAFNEVTGFAPARTFVVSARRFEKGMLPRSGILALKGWIDACAEDADVRFAFARQRRDIERGEVRRRVQSVADETGRELDRLEHEFALRTRSFEFAAEQLVEKVREAVDRIRDQPGATNPDGFCALRASLARQACGNARWGMHLLLQEHVDIVQGRVDSVIGLENLKNVASSNAAARGIDALAPLAECLRFADELQPAVRRIAALAARQAELFSLTERLE